MVTQAKYHRCNYRKNTGWLFAASRKYEHLSDMSLFGGRHNRSCVNSAKAIQYNVKIALYTLTY